MTKTASVKPSRKLVRAKNKSATARSKSATARSKSVTARSKMVTARNKPVTPRNKKKTARNKPVTPRNRQGTARNKPVTARNKPEIIETEPPESPHQRWRPEYLGQIWVLNANVPNYMPTNEADLIVWIENYIRNATIFQSRFNGILGEPSKIPLSAVNSLNLTLRSARPNPHQLAEWQRSWTAYKNILLYASEHNQTLSSPPALTVAALANVTTVGVVGMIDWQVRQLREHSNFNQTVAEALDIIPKAPPSVDLATLNPNVRVRFVGGAVEVSFRGAAGIRGLIGAVVRVDRGDGHGLQELARFITRGRVVDDHALPEKPCVWTYYVQYVRADRVLVGQIGEASIAVRASLDDK